MPIDHSAEHAPIGNGEDIAPAGAEAFTGAASQQAHQPFEERAVSFLDHLRALPDGSQSVSDAAAGNDNYEIRIGQRLL